MKLPSIFNLNKVYEHKQVVEPDPLHHSLTETIHYLKEIGKTFKQSNAFDPRYTQRIHTRSKSILGLLTLINQTNILLDRANTTGDVEVYFDHVCFSQHYKSGIEERPIYGWLTVDGVQHDLRALVDLVKMNNILLNYASVIKHVDISDEMKEYYKKCLKPIFDELETVYRQLAKIGGDA